MKINRIVAKRTNKRNAEHLLLKEAGAGILFVFLLPYVCACLWGHVGEEKALLTRAKEKRRIEEESAYEVNISLEWGVWTLPLEEYLVYKLSTVMPGSYEPEALKAQAVLLRTEFLRKARLQETDSLFLEEPALAKWYGGDRERENDLSKYREAAEETEGLYLCYEGEPILASYFQISSGRTRNAGETWHTDAYPYLAGTDSVPDKSASAYETVISVAKKEYLEKVRGLLEGEYTDEELCEGIAFSYDSAEYVTEVSFFRTRNGALQEDGGTGGETNHVDTGKKTSTERCDGEKFRYLFGLNSASFTMETRGEQIIFYVKGVGHGFGMSQYGANCKAVNGENYQEILKDYFSGTELAKIE